MPGSIVRRLPALACFSLGLGAFWYGPAILHLESDGILAWVAFTQIGGPLFAAGLCFLAARNSEQSDRSAWISFGIGSSLYVCGNLYYLYCGLANLDPVFPTLPEAAYFLMALFFAAGMARYGNVSGTVTRVQVYNFVLIYCALAVGCLFLLGNPIQHSVMTPFGTIVAFLYPALWLSVASFGIISALLYDQKQRAFPFTLLLCAVIVEALADLGYAHQLMDGSYQRGGWTQLLWVASAGLIAWAALDHIRLFKRGQIPQMRSTQRSDSTLTQAATPAVAIGIIMLSGSYSGAFGSGSFYVGFSALLGLVFAMAAGLREHRIMRTQQHLSSAAEHARIKVARSGRRLTNVLESTSDSVIVVDHDWSIEFFNARAADTLNAGEALKLGANLWTVFPVGQMSEGGDRFRAAIEAQQPLEYEEYVESADRWLAIQAYPTADGLSIFFRDISEQRRVREELHHMALHDSLTGVANRVLFQRRLKTEVDSSADVAVLLLDLDHFKEINDTLGHPFGDAILSGTAQRMRDCVQTSDMIARLGGDEFAVIASNYGDAINLMKLAQQILEAVSEPHFLEGQLVRVTASIGVALESDDPDPEQMLRNADIALYSAKTESRGEYRFFERPMQARLQQRQSLRADLATALEKDELELFYQPLLDLRSERICGFEALLRWRHPTRGMIPPETFIPVAEETGCIIDIGNWVLRTACAEAARWRDDLSIAINLSTRQFADNNLPEMIARILDRAGLAAARLELEITESALLEDSGANMKTLMRFREMGIRVALDDFGTGYSSLSYLQKFQFSKLKIDRSFIRGLPGSDASRAIVRAVISLGESLGIRVTAEGVETQAQFDCVKAGCQEAQGYLIGRPIPASGIGRLLALELPPARRISKARLAG